MVDKSAIAALSKEPESQHLELKTTLPQGAVLERIMLGMANTTGGTILLGVAEGGHIAGLSDSIVSQAKAVLEDLRGEYPRLEFTFQNHIVDGKSVLVINVSNVPTSDTQIADRSGRLWHRVGTQIRQAQAIERAPLELDGHVSDFQTHRSRQRLPFGALRAALQKIRGKCAYPDCPITDPLEVAAVSSIAPGGPRYDGSQADQDRSALTNFILLCANHHVIVDRDPVTHNLEWMARTRETWVGGKTSTDLKPPTCFLSYAWENDAHVQWVARLAHDLQSTFGVAVILDAWALRPGDSITQFMENSIQDADFVAMVLTPAYATRVKAREGGVGYEGGIVTGEMLAGRSGRRSLPLLRGDLTTSVPSFLKGRMYIDFRDDAFYTNRIEELARAIHDAPKAVPPPVGRPPWA
jgi:hypothetical protein